MPYEGKSEIGFASSREFPQLHGFPTSVGGHNLPRPFTAYS